MCIGECNQEGSNDSRGGRWGIKPVSGVAMERERDGDTAAAAAKSLQSCLTLCDPIPGILQARVLEWVAIAFSRWGCWRLYRRLEGFCGGSVVKNLPAIQETQVPPVGLEDPLEKEMATHSCILAWEIPWTEKPGGLQSPAGCKKVGHDLVPKQHQQKRAGNPVT